MTAASAAGAAAGALANRSTDRTIRKFGDMLIGAITGIFLGPAIADAANVNGDHLRIAVAFGIGLCGIVICTAVLDAAKGFKFGEWMLRFIGQKAPPP